MKTKSNQGDQSVSAEEPSHPVAIITAGDGRKRVKNVDRQQPIQRRGRSCFEWIQLIATIWIPIVLAIYTVVENKSNESIALDNRLKDAEIANISRTSEREIAEANRLNELDIAERSRKNDRDLATDQQHQNILIEYQSFLAKLIIDNGVSLNKNPGAKLAAHFMTLTALDQLDVAGRSNLIRSLYYANLITLKKTDNIFETSLIDLRQTDLTGIKFGFTASTPSIDRTEWRHLWLPTTILRNASFRYTILDCATFGGATMDSADLSFAAHRLILCLGTLRQKQTDFSAASLVNASFYKASFRFTDFTLANFTLAYMQEFRCLECNFSSAIFHKADLSFSHIFHGFTLYKGKLPFNNATLSHAVLRGALYGSISFNWSDWSNAQASGIVIRNCEFTQARMENCSFTKSFIHDSSFRNAILTMVDLSDAALFTISFVNADMRSTNLTNIKCQYCDFSNALLDDAVLQNASFLNSNFRGCRVSASQLAEAADLSGSTLPNGTFIPINAQQ